MHRIIACVGCEENEVSHRTKVRFARYLPQTSRRHLDVARSADRSRDHLARESRAVGAVLRYVTAYPASKSTRTHRQLKKYRSSRSTCPRASVICGIDGGRSDTRAGVSRNDRGGVISDDDVETRVPGSSRSRRGRRRSLTDTRCRAVLTLVRNYLNSASATRLSCERRS